MEHVLCVLWLDFQPNKYPLLGRGFGGILPRGNLDFPNFRSAIYAILADIL